MSIGIGALAQRNPRTMTTVAVKKEPPLPPEERDNQRIVEAAADALEGRSKNPSEALNEFIETFGRRELDQLREIVLPDTHYVQEQPLRAAAGMMIQGPGRGMEDRIPAQSGDQPVLLSDGEYVIPADVVSMLGDGSSDAGVRVLEAMIDRIRYAKTGSNSQAEPLDLDEVLPA